MILSRCHVVHTTLYVLCMCNYLVQPGGRSSLAALCDTLWLLWTIIINPCLTSLNCTSTISTPATWSCVHIIQSDRCKLHEIIKFIYNWYVTSVSLFFPILRSTSCEGRCTALSTSHLENGRQGWEQCTRKLDGLKVVNKQCAGSFHVKYITCRIGSFWLTWNGGIAHNNQDPKLPLIILILATRLENQHLHD